MNMGIIGLFILPIFATCVCELYDGNSDVIELTESNFPSLVTDSHDLWLVQFFSSWCGHSINLVPEFSKAAKALKGVVKVGAVDSSHYISLNTQFSIRGYPTIKIFSADKEKPQTYKGPRTSKDIVDAVLEELRSLEDLQLGGKKSNGGGGSQEELHVEEEVGFTYVTLYDDDSELSTPSYDNSTREVHSVDGKSSSGPSRFQSPVSAQNFLFLLHYAVLRNYFYDLFV